MYRVVVVIVCATLAVDASADPSAADRAVSEAQTRAAANDYIGAAAKYREAFAAEPRPDLMCNVGVAYYKAKDLPRAQRYLDQCLSIGTSLDHAFIANVKKVLAAVETALASGSYTPVDLLVQPAAATTTVDGGVPFDEPLLGSRRVWFPFGHYKLTVHAEGRVDRSVEIDAKDHTALPARVTLERAPVEPVSPPQGSATGSAEPTGSGSGSAVLGPGSAEGSGSAEETGSGSVTITPLRVQRPSIVAPIVATAASVGVGAAALGFYLSARSAAHDAGNAADTMTYANLVDKAQLRQHISWILGGVAGAGAIASGFLWYRYARTSHVEVQASGSGVALSLSGRW